MRHANQFYGARGQDKLKERASTEGASGKKP